MKKYCECFQQGRLCGDKCECFDCRNGGSIRRESQQPWADKMRPPAADLEGNEPARRGKKRPLEHPLPVRVPMFTDNRNSTNMGVEHKKMAPAQYVSQDQMSNDYADLGQRLLGDNGLSNQALVPLQVPGDSFGSIDIGDIHSY